MNNNSILNLFISYIKRHIKTIITFGFFIIIFAVIFSLYSLSLDAIFYASVLSVSMAFLLFIYDFFKYCNHHKSLCDLLNRITISLDGLPETNNLIENDYQNLLIAIYNDKAKLTSQTDFKETEMIDYYTLWVHQIKTPISAMRLLLQTEPSSRNTELLLELFKIEQYVEMVLQYLRLYNMSSDLIFYRYNIANIIKQAVRKYSTMFIQKKISLDFKEMDCYILTDEKWIVFVIEQILSNALKYTTTGTISIYMNNNAPQTLVIEDTGIGIQEEDLPRVFDKGFTGYNGRMNKKSTGIGLYLCKKILKKLSHTISITSTIGIGTKVKIDFSLSDTFIE